MTIAIRRMSARINNPSYPETSKYQEMRGTVEELCIIHMIDMIWYDMIWYDMIWYDMIRYDMIWYDMIWYDMIWYDMVWYGMAWYDIIWKGELSISWTVTCSRASPKLTLIDLLNSSNHTQPYSLILLNLFTMYIRRHCVPLKHQRTQCQGPLFFCFLFQVLVREKQQKAEQIKITKDLHPNWESMS